MNRRNKTESTVFKRFTLYFQRIPFADYFVNFYHISYLCQSNTLLNSLNYNDYGFLFTAMGIDS